MTAILVPTDFSENAWNALKYGLELYKGRPCTFHLLHVNPILSNVGDKKPMLKTPQQVEEQVLKKSRVLLEKLLERIGKLPIEYDHTFVTHTTYAFFVETIREMIRQQQIDLVLMGTKGAAGLKKLSLGSNTAAVMTKVKCPLLAIPQEATYRNLGDIAFPTDFRMAYSQNVLKNLEEIIKTTKAALRVLYMSSKDAELDLEQQRNKGILQDFLKSCELSFHHVDGRDLSVAVQYFTQSRNIDMIAMVAKNLNFLQRILFKPRIEEISYHVKLPFLVLHE
ncbi:MAG: universal stress protein [Flavobacteriaceae bacterium]